MVLESFFLNTDANKIFFAINFLLSTLETIISPFCVNTITSSISEHSSTNSSFLKDVPIKPSSLLTYNFEFFTTTFLTSTSSNIRISVFLSFPFA